jgi:hypothetical protein
MFDKPRMPGVVLHRQVSNVALLLAPCLAAPLQYMRTPTVVDINGYVVACHGRCTSTSALTTALLDADVVYVLGLLGAAPGMTFKARSIPSDFQERAYLFMATLTQLELYVVAIPIVLLVDSSQTQVVLLLLCSLIAINNCSLASLLVVPNMVLASQRARVQIPSIKAAPRNSDKSAALAASLMRHHHIAPRRHTPSQAPDINASVAWFDPDLTATAQTHKQQHRLSSSKQKRGSVVHDRATPL